MAYKRISPTPVVEGGTGAQTLTSNGVLLGNTTSAITATTAGTTGQVLTGNTGSAPTFQSPAASSISITGNTGGALTGNAFTFTGGTSGLSFGGSGSTETLSGTLIVGNGGTGVATMTTAYAPVCAGTTATGNLQVASTGLSTSGYVLTSTGSSSLPTFQAIPSGGITTLDGNSGSATGSTVTVETSNSTITTSGSGATLTLNMLGDANNNILIGSSGAITSGSHNIAMGYQAGQYITSAAHNIAIGLQAMSGEPVTANGNIAIGYQAGQYISNSSNNITIGYKSMSQENVTGNFNIMVGAQTGEYISSGSQNIAVGTSCMDQAVVTGSANIAIGYTAMQYIEADVNNIGIGLGSFNVLQSSAGNNVGVGYNSGVSLATGGYNVLVGTSSGSNYTSSESSNVLINSSGTAAESNVLRIGAGTGTSTQQLNKAFISGIQGITVTGTAVLVSSSDQLGIAVSSRKYKDNIEDMGDKSEALYKLRPTTFTYKESTETRYGLIAEEVAEVFPNLVVYDKSGDPQTVMYHELPALLLNEIQKLRKEVDTLKEIINGK